MIDQRISDLLQSIDGFDSHQILGKVSKLIGLVIEASGLNCSMGEMCQIIKPDGSFVDAEVVGFNDQNVLLMPFQETVGIAPGSRVRLHPKPFSVKVGPQILGRILDGMGNPIDDLGPLNSKIKQPVYNNPPDPLKRKSVDTVMETGIRSIDGLVTLGKGQRMGIFAGSGVGKSVLLSLIAKQSKADINVIALVGERGREVKEFIDKNLGPEGLKKSVIVVSTSDQAPMLRLKAALTATAIAEYFRDLGKDVMFMMDSLTRVAMAQREIGLAVGEPPTTKGYTPSVFSLLPKIIERAGNGAKGSITGLYTILIEGDDLDDPIGDASRSLLDGHIVLSRKLASMGHYPAINVLDSISRLANDIISDGQKEQKKKLLSLISTYKENEDLISVGAYEKGTNELIDQAINTRTNINDFLIQDLNDSTEFHYMLNEMNKAAQHG